MCDPVTLTVIGVGGLAMGAAGAGLSAYGMYQQQEAANMAADYNSQVQARNAQVSQAAADQARQQGEIDAKNHQKQVALLQGSQKAGYAGAGILVDDGTPFDVSQDTVSQGAVDALTLKRNAARQAWASEVDAANYTSSGAMTSMGKVNPLIGASSTLLTGLGNTAQGAASMGLSYQAAKPKFGGSTTSISTQKKIGG